MLTKNLPFQKSASILLEASIQMHHQDNDWVRDTKVGNGNFARFRAVVLA